MFCTRANHRCASVRFFPSRFFRQFVPRGPIPPPHPSNRFLRPTSRSVSLMPLRRPAHDSSAVLPSPILGLAPPASLCVPPQSIQRPPVPDAAHSSRRRVSRSRSAAQLAIRPPFLPSLIRGLAPPASSCMCPQSRRRPLVPDAAHSSHRRSGRPICRRSSSGLPSDQVIPPLGHGPLLFPHLFLVASIIALVFMLLCMTPRRCCVTIYPC